MAVRTEPGVLLRGERDVLLVPVVEDCDGAHEQGGDADGKRDPKHVISTGNLAMIRNRGDRARTCDLRFWRPPLYQLSYAPTLGADCSLARMPSQRHALGLLFLALTLGFGVIALAAGAAGVWLIALAATALGGWMATMSIRLLKRR